MSKITFLNGVKYTFVASTRDYRDKEPKTIKEVVQQTDFGIMGMAFKKERVKNDR